VDAIENILGRNSHKKLELPYPNSEQMGLVYKAALRAPDHAWLRPSEFIEVTGKGLDKLSQIFVSYLKDTKEDLNDLTIQKYKNAPYRAPMIIILVNTVKEHPKVPAIEQKLSTATAAQNIMLALNAMNYSSIWRTGKFAFNKMVQTELGLESNQEILGYLYIGTEIGKKKEIPSLDIDKFVRYL